MKLNTMERKNDILPLSMHFLRLDAEKAQKKIDSVAPDLAYRLLNYPFPGNVRELKNIIARAVLLEEGKSLTLASTSKLDFFLNYGPEGMKNFLTLEEVERQHLLNALNAAGGNRTRAAKILGIGLRTLRRKLKALQP